jgi:hypothetical protein
VYDDLPGRGGRGSHIAATRLDVDAVIRLVRRYDEVFGTKDDERTRRIAQTLADAMGRYRVLDQSPDAAKFRGYLERTPEEGQALAYVQQLEGLVADMKKLGLPPSQLAKARERLYAGLAASGAKSGS